MTWRTTNCTCSCVSAQGVCTTAVIMTQQKKNNITGSACNWKSATNIHKNKEALFCWKKWHACWAV